MTTVVILTLGVLLLRRILRNPRVKIPMPENFTYIEPRTYTGVKSYVDERGYLRFIDSDKLVHRYIAEKKLGRKLETWEVVHHIDGNKRNNSFRNLEVYQSWEEHDAVHRNNLAVFGNWHQPAK